MDREGIRGILNPAYKGLALAYRSTVVEEPRLDKATRLMRSVKHTAPGNALIPLPEGTIPAIVTADEWDLAQATLKTQPYGEERQPDQSRTPQPAAQRGLCLLWALWPSDVWVRR